MNLAHIILDDLVTGNVLEDDGGKGKIKLQRRHYGKIAAVILIQENVGPIGNAARARAIISPLTSTA